MKNIGTNDHLTRQMDIIPMSALQQDVTIVGGGAIGSWVALSLAKMGFGKITIFDDDAVTVENMNCQFFPYEAIGQLKVAALHRMIKQFANVEIVPVAHRFTGKESLEGIVISAVDSMEARKLIWNAAKDNKSKALMVIDPRMGAETSLLYIMNPRDKKDIVSYEKTLYSDANAVQERCTAKATIYCANLLAGSVVKGVKDLAIGTPYTRVMQWDIGKNHVQIFTKKVE